MAFRLESQAEPIPGYKLIERLGGGGFGEVWKAEAPGGLLKAIKFVYGDLQTADDEGQQRAEQELKAMSRVKTVRHPYILSLERYDIIDGQLMIVMELADRNLWDRFRECRNQGLPGIPREELLSYMEESAEALDLMNVQYQLQHLDIKPQNIFLVYNHIKVADFGLVKDLEGMAASVTGGVTPVYAAPETFDGWVSRFCDQYSLAIVYQELLTGQRPFSGNNVRQLILQHLQGIPNLEPLPPADRDAVGRALSKSPDSRFPNCELFVKALRTGSGAGTAATTTAAPAAEATSAPVATPAATPTDQQAPITPVPAKTPASQPSRETVVPTAAPARPVPATAAAEDEAVERPRVGETKGDGVLMPVVIVGLGQVGLSVLQRLHESLDAHAGTLEGVSTFRLLYLDTDPEAQRVATSPRFGLPLTNDEILLARLNRPTHYLRSRESRAHIDSWFNPKMLYRIPRNLVTTGMRALGRLAFFDNFRTLGRRLRTELETCTNPVALNSVIDLPGLGLRTNVPRVYVVSGLAGGTGSGMFLDVAYVARSLIRELGYDRAEVVGVFALPAVDDNPARTLALGNTFAALTELYHYSSAGTTFTARYDGRDNPIKDPTPPFDRCVLVTLPDAADDTPLRELGGSLADYLYRDALTPLGRAADEARLRGAPPPGQPRDPFCQTYGIFRLSWPRRPLLQRVARHLCKRVVQRWMTKESAPLRENVRAWVQEQWARHNLAAESLIGVLQAACEKALGQIPESAFAAVTNQLAPATSSNAEQQLPAVREALKQLELLVGKPEGSPGARTTQLKETLETAADEAAASWGQRMKELALRLIEQPEFRLAGAEEAIRQFVAQIEQVLEHYEPLVSELATRVSDAHARILGLLANKQEIAAGGRRAATLVNNLIELLKLYPKWRYQSLVLQKVASTYVSLRGTLSDQLRDVNFCRARLGELYRSFEEVAGAAGQAGGDLGKVLYFFPAGCRNLDDAVNQFLERMTPADLEELDGRIQRLIQQDFTALVYVCLTSANLLRNLEEAMEKEAQAFAATRVEDANVAEMFFAAFSQEQTAMQAIAEAFEAAAPDPVEEASSVAEELCVLAVPPGAAGDRFCELAEYALQGVTLVTTNSPDDIVFYREVTSISLAALQQLGPQAAEAYRQMTTLEHFTPHSRTDVAEWHVPGE